MDHVRENAPHGPFFAGALGISTQEGAALVLSTACEKSHTELQSNFFDKPAHRFFGFCQDVGCTVRTVGPPPPMLLVTEQALSERSACFSLYEQGPSAMWCVNLPNRF